MKNKLSTFLWTLGNGMVAILITYIGGIDIQYSVIIIPFINLITKSLNEAFNPNYKK